MAFFKHPTAIVESDHIGDETKIWHFAHVRAGAKIGKKCVVGKSAYIDADVELGNGVKIQNFVSVYKRVRIEDEVLVGPSVTFTNDSYPRAFSWGEDKITSTVVKKGASIGANSTIVCGVTIGDYALVGAGSVVTKDVPPFGLVYGNPAELKGFVCYCGRKLRKTIREENEKIVYQCECGKEVETTRLHEIHTTLFLF
jgi:acetyltransferase-like isoleucine patch superfamily enzyme